MRAIIILLFLTSCGPSLYYVTTNTTFDEVNNQPYKKKLIYLDQGMGTMDKLDSIATAINKKKWKRLDESIRMLPNEDRQFLTSIKHLVNEEFLASYDILNSLDDEAYECQVKILKTDCLYELGVDSVNFKSNYQGAMNCTQTEIIKSIINTRYRFLRYGK